MKTTSAKATAQEISAGIRVAGSEGCLPQTLMHLPRPFFSSISLAVAICCATASPLLAQSTKKRPSPTPKPTATTAPAVTGSPSADYPVPNVVAKVDGASIQKKDLERIAEALLTTNGRHLKELNATEKKRILGSVLEDMIVDKIISKLSAGEQPDPLQVEERFEEVRRQYPDEKTFNEQVRKAGQTTEQVRQGIRAQLAQQQWIERRIAEKITVTPEEAEKFYKESPPNQFDAPEVVRATHILAAVTRSAPPEEALAAENKINALAARIKKGESFEELAKNESDAGDAKEKGGQLDWFSQDRTMPEFADAAFRLKVGEVSAPVRTQFGYHLIKLTDRKAGYTATFDQAKPQITSYLTAQKRKLAISRLTQSLRDDAKVEIFLP